MTRSRAFFGALALATVLPMIVIPLAVALGASALPNGYSMISYTMAAIGSGHIGSTAGFFFDRPYVPVMRRGLYLAAGGIPAVAAVLAVACSPTALLLAYVGYLVWQAYHYQRQNYGITALAAAHEGIGRLPPRLNRALVTASVAGAVALLAVPTAYPIHLAGLLDFSINGAPYIRAAAVLIYVIAAADFVLLLRHSPALRSSHLTLGCATASLAFFLPGLLSTDSFISFWSYAAAHGLQYLIIAGISVWRSPARIIATGAFIIGAAGVFLGGGLQADAVLWPIYFGITVLHFVVDSRLWRMREPAQRQILRQRFDFVFAS
jgi:hypothetical protein